MWSPKNVNNKEDGHRERGGVLEESNKGVNEIRGQVYSRRVPLEGTSG